MGWWWVQKRLGILLLLQILKQNTSGTDLGSLSRRDLATLKVTGGALNSLRLKISLSPKQCCFKIRTLYWDLILLSFLMVSINCKCSASLLQSQRLYYSTKTPKIPPHWLIPITHCLLTTEIQVYIYRIIPFFWVIFISIVVICVVFLDYYGEWLGKPMSVTKGKIWVLLWVITGSYLTVTRERSFHGNNKWCRCFESCQREKSEPKKFPILKIFVFAVLGGWILVRYFAQ